MKVRFLIFCLFLNLPLVIYSQWNNYDNADTTNLDLKKQDRINIWVFDVVDKNILEKNNLFRLISLINSNQLDSNVFSFVIHVRTGVQGAVCMEKESYTDQKKSVEVLSYNYPIILIDTAFRGEFISRCISETFHMEEQRLFQPIVNTSVLRIDGKDAGRDYGLLQKLLQELQKNRTPDTYYASNFSISVSPFTEVFANVRLNDKAGAGMGRNYSFGVDYEYRGGAGKKPDMEKSKNPWFGLGVGLHFSNAFINKKVDLLHNYKDAAVDADQHEFRLLVEAKELKESINLRSIELPVFVSFSICKNRNLNLKLGCSISWIYGSLHSNGSFTYKGVYYLNTIYQDTLDDTYQGIAEKYGFYSNYPLTSDKKLQELDLFKKINFSLLAEINYKVKISRHADFIIGVNGNFGLRDLLKNNTSENFMISTGINDYHSLLSGYKRIFLNFVSLKTGINFSF